MAIRDDVSDAEGLVILAALGVGAWMLYTLWQTIVNGPSELASWAGQAVSNVATDIGQGTLDEEAGENMYANPGYTDQ